jgi:FdhD protein
MCREEPHPEWELAATEFCRISAWREGVLPGYACVLSTQHVIEPFELDERAQAGFFLDAMAAARGLARLFSPAKMNYEIHGNTVPHLHMHLFPRMPGDVYVGYPNHCRTMFIRSDEEIDRMRRAVRAELRGRLLTQPGLVGWSAMALAERPPDGGVPRTHQVMVFEPRNGVLARRGDRLAVEEPLEIRLEAPTGASTLTVTMRTPGNDMELVAGWLLAEGIVEEAEDIAQISYCVDAANGGDQRFNVVTASLRVPPRQSGRERMTVTSSACGVCGTASIEALRAVGFPPLGDGPTLALSTLTDLPELLRAGQRTFQVTGAVHGAALVDATGTALIVREDVGRHNAVDKVVGWALLNRYMPLTGTVLVVSGRV